MRICPFPSLLGIIRFAWCENFISWKADREGKFLRLLTPGRVRWMVGAMMARSSQACIRGCHQRYKWYWNKGSSEAGKGKKKFVSLSRWVVRFGPLRAIFLSDRWFEKGPSSLYGSHKLPTLTLPMQISWEITIYGRTASRLLFYGRSSNVYIIIRVRLCVSMRPVIIFNNRFVFLFGWM